MSHMYISLKFAINRFYRSPLPSADAAAVGNVQLNGKQVPRPLSVCIIYCRRTS